MSDFKNNLLVLLRTAVVELYSGAPMYEYIKDDIEQGNQSISWRRHSYD
jgi:hypothetical protein